MKKRRVNTLFAMAMLMTFGQAEALANENTQSESEGHDGDMFHYGFNHIYPANSDLPYLRRMTTQMKQNPNLKIRIISHGCAIGTDEANMKVSQMRAAILKDYFRRHGIGESRIETIWRGEEEPMADNDTERGRSLNRRSVVQLIIPSGDIAQDMGKPDGEIRFPHSEEEWGQPSFATPTPSIAMRQNYNRTQNNTPPSYSNSQNHNNIHSAYPETKQKHEDWELSAPAHFPSSQQLQPKTHTTPHPSDTPSSMENLPPLSAVEEEKSYAYPSENERREQERFSPYKEEEMVLDSYEVSQEKDNKYEENQSSTSPTPLPHANTIVDATSEVIPNSSKRDRSADNKPVEEMTDEEKFEWLADLLIEDEKSEKKILDEENKLLNKKEKSLNKEEQVTSLQPDKTVTKSLNQPSEKSSHRPIMPVGIYLAPITTDDIVHDEPLSDTSSDKTSYTEPSSHHEDTPLASLYHPTPLSRINVETLKSNNENTNATTKAEQKTESVTEEVSIANQPSGIKKGENLVFSNEEKTRKKTLDEGDKISNIQKYEAIADAYTPDVPKSTPITTENSDELEEELGFEDIVEEEFDSKGTQEIRATQKEEITTTTPSTIAESPQNNPAEEKTTIEADSPLVPKTTPSSSEEDETSLLDYELEKQQKETVQEVAEKPLANSKKEQEKIADFIKNRQQPEAPIVDETAADEAVALVTEDTPKTPEEVVETSSWRDKVAASRGMKKEDSVSYEETEESHSSSKTTPATIVKKQETENRAIPPTPSPTQPKYQPQFNSEGKVVKTIRLLDEDTGQPISLSHIAIKASGGELQLASNENGELQIPAKASMKGEVDFFAAGYFFQTETISKDNDLQIVRLKKVAGGNKVALKNLYFKSGTAEILPSSYPELDKLYQSLRINPDVKVEVGGHINVPFTRPEDITERQMNISISRAKSVFNYLVNKGISTSRISYKGYGNSEMIYPQATTAAEKAQNRRVEIKIIR